MAIFKIEFERLYKDYQDLGRSLKGIFCIQYPIYCIHANIEDRTSDPLDNVDRVIMEFLLENPSLSLAQLGALVGVTKFFIKQRVDVLLKEGFLVRFEGRYETTPLALEVFKDRKLNRTHLRSYDFYLDGMSFNPLPASYYGRYRSNFISEHDLTLYTRKDGSPDYSRPFTPDLVHTPPDKEIIIAKIFSFLDEERERYYIPRGLTAIKEISFTRLSIQLLVAVSTKGKEIYRELIDGHTFYSLNKDMSYLDTLKDAAMVFFPRLKEKIECMEFRLFIQVVNNKLALTTNWPEIEKYKGNHGRCFNFTNEDLINYIRQNFNVSYAEEENIVNTDTDVEISITKNILERSDDKQKLMRDLVRKRSYRLVGNMYNNVFLFYLYFSSADPFVKEAIKFKEFLDALDTKKGINRQFFDRHRADFKYPFRQLMLAMGEFDWLERLDIEQFMTLIQ